MEFWGVEVKAGEPLKVEPGVDRILHLSQASLGEVKKDKVNESVPLFLNFDGQKLVIGTLSAEKCSHITYDLVFEKEFELSHNWKNGSVYFCGYKSVIPEEDEDSSDYDSGEDLPLVTEEKGKPDPKDAPLKLSTDNAKSTVKLVQPSKEEKVKQDGSEDDDSDEDDSEDESDDESESQDEEMGSPDEDDSDDEEDEDESSDEEDEATPNKAEQSKKRPAESGTKTPTGKKAKLVTPQKAGGEGKKTGGHIATPYPSKQAGKITANNEKSKKPSPASDGQVICGFCSKSFKSNQALESHSKAKHGVAK